MITIFDAVDLVANVIDNSTLKTFVSGGIYKLERPDNSKVEDIVILPITQVDDQWSEGVINVNIHVPNMQVAIKDKATGDIRPQSKPNTIRLKSIAEQVKNVLQDFWGNSTNSPYQMYIQSQNIINDNISHEYYFNIRISYQYYN